MTRDGKHTRRVCIFYPSQSQHRLPPKAHPYSMITYR